MALSTAQLSANINIVGANEAKAILKDVGVSVNATGGIFKTALGGALNIAANGAGMALNGLKDIMVSSVQVAMKHQQVMAQTTEVIKSTGAVSGMSAKSIDDLADSLSRTTTFSHDSVQAGENLMLTFTGIGKKVFPEATQAMLDLSQATGQSLKSSAIQLGKALNDPLTGLSALARVGVSFSSQETQQIKTMMAHNNVMGAQKVMLKELETEFGGSAAAAGKTFAGQMAILNNVLEDTKEKVGTALLPIINQFMGFVVSVGLPVVQKLSDWFSTVAVGAIQKFFDKLSPFKDVFGKMHNSVILVTDDLHSLFYYATQALDPVTKKLSGLGKGLSIRTIVNDVEAGINDIANAFDHMTHTIDVILKHINLKPMVDNISSIVSKIDFKPLENGANAVGKFLENVFSHINFTGIGNDINLLSHIFLNLSPAVNLFQALSSHAQELGKWFNTSLVPAIKGAEPGFKNLMQSLQGLLPAMLTISNVIHDYLQKAFNDLLPVFMKVIPVVIQIAGIVANGLGMAIKFLTPYVIQATTAILQFSEGIIQRVSPIVIQFFNSLQVALNWLSKYWPQIWGTLSPFLSDIWYTITGIIKIAWAIITGIFNISLDLLSGNWSRAWEDMKNMLGGIWGGIKDLIRGGVNGMIGVLDLGIDSLNNFIHAVENALNAAAKAVGLGSPIPITTIPLIPAYANGTPIGGHPGGAALVGERGPEIALLPKGTGVIPAHMTSRILSGMPAYADGTNNILDSLMSWVSGGAQSILDNLLKGVSLNMNLGPMSGMAGGIVKMVEKWALDWITKTLMPSLPSGGSAGPGQAVNIPGNLASWIMSAIGLTGVPASWANDLGIIAMHESGGNPNAVNNWDSNAAAGHPSQGIMQTIPSTFAAYMVAGHGNILNPIDNIAAAIGYIKSRYGSVFNVPGIVSMSNGGAYQGYADGTDYAEGGFHWVGERGKELMYVPRGAQITPHEALNKSSQPIQVIVQSPPITLDGQVITRGLLPHIANQIRYGIGTHGL